MGVEGGWKVPGPGRVARRPGGRGLGGGRGAGYRRKGLSSHSTLDTCLGPGPAAPRCWDLDDSSPYWWIIKGPIVLSVGVSPWVQGGAIHCRKTDPRLVFRTTEFQCGPATDPREALSGPRYPIGKPRGRSRSVCRPLPAQSLDDPGVLVAVSRWAGRRDEGERIAAAGAHRLLP